ncbi:MAG TPA: SUV3 C-terminal domain-containing protein, partial [Methylotenera sp.]|nr:SUV3 C-terminal domain-containing protein [Methylotenera sp.]
MDDTSEIQKLPISTQYEQLETIATQLHTRKIAEVLQFLQDRTRLSNPLFEQSLLNTQIEQAKLVDINAPNMSLKDKFIFVCAPTSLNVAFEKDYYLLCLQSVALSNIRHLPKAPIWLEANSPKHLEEAELLSQNLSLYAWLGFKFPQIFIEHDAVPALRKSISRYIENALLTQSGYGETSREVEVKFLR